MAWTCWRDRHTEGDRDLGETTERDRQTETERRDERGREIGTEMREGKEMDRYKDEGERQRHGWTTD